jgi:hypothetical protein
MKVKKAYILKFLALSSAILFLVVAALSLMASENVLTKAARASDTITINARYNSAKKTLSATQTVRYRNRSKDTLSHIKFHIYANAYRNGARFPPVTESEIERAFPNGKSYGAIYIDEVQVSGRNVPIFIEGDDQNVLSVPLFTTLRPNQSIDIFIDYTVQLANIAHRLGWTDNAVNLGNFYPVPVIYENGVWQTYPYSFNGDPFYNALHNFDVTLHADSRYIVASSGTLQRQSAGVHRFRSQAIRDFAMVLSRNFKSLTRMVGSVAVSYFYLDDSNPTASLQCAVDALRTFSRLFTKYPYRQLTVVQTDFLHGGMEYGELVFVSKDLLAQNQRDLDAARQFHNQVIIHEIAHQWWYGIIGNNQARTAWIDEGLAEYSTLLFYDLNPQYSRLSRADIVSNARDNFVTYSRLVQAVGGRIDPDMTKDLNSFRSTHEYVFMTYVRGMLLFVDLEMLLGQDKIIKALRNFAREAKFSFATKDSLILSMERSTRVQLRTFFESFLTGATIFENQLTVRV